METEKDQLSLSCSFKTFKSYKTHSKKSKCLYKICNEIHADPFTYRAFSIIEDF